MSSILLVEDGPTQAMQMKMLLESAAHEVICCDDGTAAIDHLAGGHDAPRHANALDQNQVAAPNVDIRAEAHGAAKKSVSARVHR